MGGLQAMALPLTARIRARAFIAVAAWIPNIREFATMLDRGPGRDLSGYIVVGRRDPSCDGAKQLVALLTKHRVHAHLDLREDLGHEYPPDMPETRVLLEDLKELNLEYIPTDGNISNRELFKRVTKIIRQETFDLVHSHGFTSGACSIVGALFKRTPHILTSHDVFTQQQFIGVKGFVRKKALGVMLVLIDCIHCVSHDARDNLLAYLPILKLCKHKVIAIPNGIEIEPFLTAEKRDLRRELGLPPERNCDWDVTPFLEMNFIYFPSCFNCRDIYGWRSTESLDRATFLRTNSVGGEENRTLKSS